MNHLYHPMVLSFIVGVATFICSYKWSTQIIEFFKNKTSDSQREIIEIMDRLLISTNKKKIITQCWILSLSLGALIFFLLLPHILLGLVLGTLSLVLTWNALQFLLKKIWERHCNKISDQLVEALTIMCNSLKAGLGLTQAMERVINAVPGALAKEFGLILNKVKLGQSIEEALTEFGSRIKKSDVDMLVSAINILKETGGNLSETFFVMAETIRDRQKMEKKIKALTAQGVMQAKIISSMPFLLLLVFQFMDPDHIRPLFTKPLGWACLIFVIGLVAVGATIMKKVVEIKV